MGKKIKEIKLRIFPKNKENLLKIFKFQNKIRINKNHSHFVRGIEKISEGSCETLRISYRYPQEYCGKVFLPFRKYLDFPEWSENEFVTFFICEEMLNSIIWFCKLKKIEWEETTQEY